MGRCINVKYLKSSLAAVKFIELKPSSKMGKCINVKYLKSSLAAVKFIELLCLLASAATVFFFHWEVQIQGTALSRVQFFLLVTITAWLLELIVFVMILTRMTKNLPVPWPWVNIVFGILFGVFALIATGLLTSSVASLMMSKQQWPKSNREWETIDYCEYINRTKSKTSCLAIQGGVGFGLLSVILLFVDVYVNSKEVRKDNYLQGPTVKKEILIDDITASTVLK